MFNLGGIGGTDCGAAAYALSSGLNRERLGKTIWFAGCLLIAVSC